MQVLGILGLLFLAFTALDWCRFAAGLGEETLWMVGKVLKLSFTTVCALTVFLGRRAALDGRDWKRLAVAFAIILLGDAAFFAGWSIPAVGIFTLAQIAMAVRNASGLPAFIRSGGLVRSRGRAIGAAAAILALDGLAIATAFRGFLTEAGPAMVAVGVIYALFLSASVWIAWMAPASGRFPAGSAALIAAAMTLFYLCDVTVGVGGVHEGTAAGVVARNLTWLFYGPALAMLVSSGRGVYLSSGRQ